MVLHSHFLEHSLLAVVVRIFWTNFERTHNLIFWTTNFRRAALYVCSSPKFRWQQFPGGCNSKTHYWPWTDRPSQTTPTSLTALHYVFNNRWIHVRWSRRLSRAVSFTRKSGNRRKYDIRRQSNQPKATADCVVAIRALHVLNIKVPMTRWHTIRSRRTQQGKTGFDLMTNPKQSTIDSQNESYLTHYNGIDQM